ncbi:hypothetical protein V8D89_009018 [Ganoderma adspersum]
MSDRVTRKRSHPEQEEDSHPAKRGPRQDGSAGTEHHGSGPAGTGNTQADGQTIGGGAVEQDEEFWFDDGTVVLVARDTEFRVYRGVLAGLSSVFKDLFAEHHALREVCMNIQGVPTFPCPVVHVSDSPEDLRHLLRACFPKRLGRLYDERQPSYHEISAAIRLGDKYELTELYSQSLEYLKHYYPSTFDSWAELTDYGPPDWEASEVIGVINLARFTGELSILPSAFVACLCAEPTTSAIARGITREDGSQERLSPDDLVVCLEGTSSLRVASITAIFRTFEAVVSAECKTVSACRRVLRNTLLNLKDDIDHLLYGDPFARYQLSVAKDGLGTCPSCTTMVSERSLKERRDVWDRLPELFGIDVPGWKMLPPW